MMSIVTQSKEECPQNVHHGFIVTSLGLYEHDSTLNMSCVNDVKEAFLESVDVEEDEIVEKMNSTLVEDSDDEESPTTIPVETKVEEVKAEVAEEVEKKVALEDQPKKKRVVKKKAADV